MSSSSGFADNKYLQPDSGSVVGGLYQLNDAREFVILPSLIMSSTAADVTFWFAKTSLILLTSFCPRYVTSATYLCADLWIPQRE
ncbi:hypothetical protein BaRGS_00018859 [Batillaria attramentaria]|uniref:Uncharacterized protein n=1 Tax=Batillaria attramentaria TaxID=370345 RepID=A0ABD0KSV3_9CAEN